MKTLKEMFAVMEKLEFVASALWSGALVAGVITMNWFLVCLMIIMLGNQFKDLVHRLTVLRMRRWEECLSAVTAELIYTATSDGRGQVAKEIVRKHFAKLNSEDRPPEFSDPARNTE